MASTSLVNYSLSIAGLHQFDHIMHKLEWIWSQSDKAGSAANKNPGSSKICWDVNGDDGREMDIEWRKKQKELCQVKKISVLHPSEDTE